MADSGLPPLVERPYEQDNYAFPSPGRNFSHNVPRNGTPWPPMQATSFATTDASGFPTNSPGQWTQSPGFLMQPAFVAHPAVGWPGMTPGIGIIPPPLAPSASTPAQFTRENDEWVSIERDPEQERIREREHEDRTWGNWPRDRDALPIGFRDHPPRPRSQLSRAASTSRRPHSPFSSSNSSPLSRSGSFSNSRVRSRSFTRPVAEAEKRPPREWRPDFSMIRSSSLASALGSIFNSPKRTHTMSKRDAAIYSKVTLHPYLRHTSDSQMYLDLRENPANVLFLPLSRPINPWDLTRFACEPPLPHMRLYSPYYPWYIEVESTNPSGVTLHELFLAIWNSVMMPIRQEDYWNNEMDEEVRERIGRAWAARCGDREEDRAAGVRRVDFLMDRVVLDGFSKGKEGMWEMKLRKA